MSKNTRAVAAFKKEKKKKKKEEKKNPFKTCPASAAATVGLRRIPDWLKEVR